MPRNTSIITPLSAFAQNNNDNSKLQIAKCGFNKFSSPAAIRKHKVVSKSVAKSKTTRSKSITHSTSLPLSIGTTYGTTQPAFMYNPTFLLDPQQRGSIMKHLAEDVPWSIVKYNRYGKEHITPRYTYCYGTPMADNTPCIVHWKNSTSIAEPMPLWLKQLCTIVQEATNKYLTSIGLPEVEFNIALLNYYADGSQHISEHKDDNGFLQHTTIASLSFGDERTFKVKVPNPTSPDTNIIHKVPLQSGSLALLINGPLHQLPKSTSTNSRFNISIRSVKRPPSDKIMFNEQHNMYECIGDTGFGNHCKYTKQTSQ
jgi:alkylated DNA repair dioxygenase AlkB